MFRLKFAILSLACFLGVAATYAGATMSLIEFGITANLWWLGATFGLGVACIFLLVFAVTAFCMAKDEDNKALDIDVLRPGFWLDDERPTPEDLTLICPVCSGVMRHHRKVLLLNAHVFRCVDCKTNHVLRSVKL